jgi:hypothetical protein
MDALCRLSHDFEEFELPSYERRSTAGAREITPVTRLVSDNLPPPVVIKLTPRPYRLNQVEHSILRKALRRSVTIRNAIPRV